MPAITIEQALEVAAVHYRARQFALAETLYRQILSTQPREAEALHRLGTVALQTGRNAEAAELISAAIALRPNHPAGYADLGVAWRRLGEPEKAVASYQRALALRNDDACVHYNLGNVLLDLWRFEEAIASFRRAIELRPDYAEAHFNLALQLLRLGQFEEGWSEYEWCWLAPSFVAQRRDFRVPQWNGRSAPGSSILIHTEQGFGDAIQMLRYVPLVQSQSGAARVFLECQPELIPLLARGDRWNVEFIPRTSWGTDHLPPLDLHVPFCGLPKAVRTSSPLPESVPYLHADPALCATWRKRLGDRKGFRVGLAWSGNPKNPLNRTRSLDFDRLLPLLRVKGCEFFSLQVGSDISPQRLAELGVTDPTTHLCDFAETAALMSELDLVISVDTAIVHLAGALGRPVWTLLEFVPYWVWGLQPEEVVWYPTMRIFRQPTPGDWDAVVHRVRDRLAIEAGFPSRISGETSK